MRKALREFARRAKNSNVSRTEDLAAARDGSVAGSAAAAGLEESHWLCPIEDRRGVDSPREGMIEGFSLGNYLLLVDYTSRLFREGKTTISQEVAEILQRLGSSADGWQARLEQLKRRGGRLLGRFFAVTRERLRAVAKLCGVHHLANLGGCPPAELNRAHESGSLAASVRSRVELR